GVTSSRERLWRRGRRSQTLERVILSPVRLTLTVEDASSVGLGMGISVKGCSFGESTLTGASLSIIPFTRVARGSTTRGFPLRRLARKNRWAALFMRRLHRTYLRTLWRSLVAVQ